MLQGEPLSLSFDKKFCFSFFSLLIEIVPFSITANPREIETCLVLKNPPLVSVHVREL